MNWPLPDDGWQFREAPQPAGEVDGDVRLTYRVADALLADDRTRNQRVSVEVQNGVVLLGGTVRDQPAAELVTALVRRVPGVRDVCNAMRTRVRTTVEPDRESEAFDKIVAALSIEEAPPRAGRPAQPVLVLLVATVLLVLGGLVLSLGWPGALIACGVGAGLLEMGLRRRKKRG